MMPSFQDATGCPEGAFKKTLSEQSAINAMKEYYIRKITKKNIEINRMKNQIKMLTQPTLDAQ